MPIRVTCSKCHTRFNVSDKFAGKEGPCPKCKATIKIPEKTEEVVIAVPDDAPKDSAGRSILKPIGRKETRLSGVQITLIAVSVIGFFVAALMLRMMYTEGSRERNARRQREAMLEWAGDNAERKAALKKYCQAILDGDFEVNEYAEAALKEIIKDE